MAYGGASANLRAAQIALSGTLQSGATIALNANTVDALGTLDAATALQINGNGNVRGWIGASRAGG